MIVIWLVTTISFLIISRIPFLGIDIDSLGKAAISAAVFGILNAVLLPIMTILTLPVILVSLGLFFFVLNAIVFGISAAIVPGFSLRYGFWIALLGSITLAFVNSLLLTILPPVF
jgi:putative membrane protein